MQQRSIVLSLLSIVALGLGLGSCYEPEQGATEIEPTVVPDGLKDCKFFSMVQGGTLLTVVRCPNSNVSVTYHCGTKTCSTTTSDHGLNIDKGFDRNIEINSVANVSDS